MAAVSNGQVYNINYCHFCLRTDVDPEDSPLVRDENIVSYMAATGKLNHSGIAFGRHVVEMTKVEDSLNACVVTIQSSRPWEDHNCSMTPKAVKELKPGERVRMEEEIRSEAPGLVRTYYEKDPDGLVRRVLYTVRKIKAAAE